MWENDKGWNQKKPQNYNNWSSKGDRKEIQQTRNNDTYIVTITQKLNNIDTARTRNVTSVTTGKERKRKAPWTAKTKFIYVGKTEN